MDNVLISVPVADMRRSPDHRSERVSQALYGRSATVIELRDDLSLCETEDGYRGWIGNSYLAGKHPPSGNVSIVTSLLAVFDGAHRTGRLTLPYGARIISGGGDLFHTLDGQEVKLIFGRLSVPESPGITQVLEEALSLISTPYLWGGTSSFGFDCSGFTQSIYRRLGIALPRDSRDQSNCGSEVWFEESISGDLVFFPGHVAIHLGQNAILHSSRLRGMVAVDSLSPELPGFRADLADKITTVRRVLK